MKFGRKRGVDPRYSLVPLFALEGGATIAHGTNVSYEPQFPAVFDQGEFGTCVANAALGIHEFYTAKRVGARISASRTGLYAAAKAFNYSGNEDMQDDGLWPSDALDVEVKVGWVQDADWPYDSAHLLTCPPLPLFRKTTLPVGYRAVGTTVDALRAALAAHGPLMTGFDWPSAWMDTAPDNILPPADPSDVAGGHEVVLVGFSDTKQAFRLRNSWGTGWGDNGHAWLPYSGRMPVDAFILDYPH